MTVDKNYEVADLYEKIELLTKERDKAIAAKDLAKKRALIWQDANRLNSESADALAQRLMSALNSAEDMSVMLKEEIEHADMLAEVIAMRAPFCGKKDIPSRALRDHYERRKIDFVYSGNGKPIAQAPVRITSRSFANMIKREAEE